MAIHFWNEYFRPNGSVNDNYPSSSLDVGSETTPMSVAYSWAVQADIFTIAANPNQYIDSSTPVLGVRLLPYVNPNVFMDLQDSPLVRHIEEIADHDYQRPTPEPPLRTKPATPTTSCAIWLESNSHKPCNLRSISTTHRYGLHLRSLLSCDCD
jgi:hypothetical protein